MGTSVGSSAISGGIEIAFPVRFSAGVDNTFIFLAGNVEAFANRFASTGVDEDTLASGRIARGVLASERLDSFAVGSKIII